MGGFSKLLPSDTLPKWQVALIISVPVAFGLGYLYYKLNVTKKQIIIAKTVETKTETVPVKEVPIVSIRLFDSFTLSPFICLIAVELSIFFLL